VSFDAIVGHERPLRVLKRALASGRIAHAYLFWGPDGIGKELAARAAARVLLCRDAGALERGEGCGRCDGCAKCDAGEHPDLHLLSPGEKAISVDAVRGLQEALGLRAYESGRKIAIIRDAFRMSREAANALLKTVEEPPAGVFLFLLAHHRSQLLPTLVSRCQPLRFDPLPEGSVMALLEARGFAGETARRLAALSGGSPGAALCYESTPEEVVEEVARVADGLARMGVAERFALAERWSRDKEGLHLRLDLLERAWRRQARSGAEGTGELARLFAARDRIERNINAELALDLLFLSEGAGSWEEIA